jgi:hypothetical protein
VTFQAFRMNRAHVVIDNRSKLPVGGPFDTMDGAQAEADRLNLELWRNSRPVSLLSEPMVWGDDWEGRLLEILNKSYGLEIAAAA